ncbi:MAG: hypothetical protein ABI251_09095 [Mycobacteriaceae bacterium]
MDTKADLCCRRSVPYGEDDAPALNGLVGAALAVSAAALVLALLAHTTELTLGTTTRAVVIIGALVLGAVAGWVGHRLRHHGVPADRLRPRSVR